jgi:hypothetical protein
MVLKHVQNLRKIGKFLLETYELENNAWLRGLYNERTYWVPAYMKDTFWAGMNTTQRSESMNAFFDGYVHSQTTLKEFVDQFDCALMKMVERETNSDFDSFNRMIPCVGSLPLEEAFQAVYTNAKFKEVQKEFMKVMTNNNSLVSSEGAISTYKVVESDVVNRNIKDVEYCVSYNEEEVEVKCSCALFETRGILCRHVISVLTSKKVSELPQRYFLARWRKDIKRTYTSVNSSYDGFGDDPNDERYNRLCKKLNKLALIASSSVEKYKRVDENADMLMVELSEKMPEPIRRSQHISAGIASSSCNQFLQSNDGSAVQSNIVLSPVKVKRLGRPKTTRMVSTLEKEVNRSQQKKGGCE